MQPENTLKWQLAARVNHPGESIFKLKAINEQEFITHLPRKKIIQTFDNSLTNKDRSFAFSQEIQAIDKFDVKGVQFVGAGTQKGVIQLKNLLTNETYKLQAPEPIPLSQRYINDMLYLGDGRLINCYNNGAVALWNLNDPLSDQLTPLSYKKVHSSFTYKLRRMDPETVLTCSNDRYAKLLDLETNSIIGSFLHEDSIWCSYPLNQNVFCSTGLINKIVFWDARLKRIVNKCELEQEQTSFVTRFDQNNIIFGDSIDLCTCDLRKPMRVKLGNMRMKISAQSILIRQNEIIAVGRGGDLCRFVNSEEDIQPVQSAVGFQLNEPNNLLEYLLHLRHLGAFNRGVDLNDDDEIDPQLLLDVRNPDEYQQLQLEEHPQLDVDQNEYVHMLDEDASLNDLEELPEGDGEWSQEDHGQEEKQESKPYQHMDIEPPVEHQKSQEGQSEQLFQEITAKKKQQRNLKEDQPEQ